MSKHLHVMIEESIDKKIRDMCERSGDISYYVRILLDAGLKYRETTEIKQEEDPKLTHLHVTIPNPLYARIKKLCTRRGDLSWIVRELLIVGLTASPAENNNEEGTSEDNNSTREAE